MLVRSFLVLVSRCVPIYGLVSENTTSHQNRLGLSTGLVSFLTIPEESLMSVKITMPGAQAQVSKTGKLRTIVGRSTCRTDGCPNAWAQRQNVPVARPDRRYRLDKCHPLAAYAARPRVQSIVDRRGWQPGTAGSGQTAAHRTPYVDGPASQNVGERTLPAKSFGIDIPIKVATWIRLFAIALVRGQRRADTRSIQRQGSDVWHPGRGRFLLRGGQAAKHHMSMGSRYLTDEGC